MKLTNFWGDLTDISAGKAALVAMLRDVPSEHEGGSGMGTSKAGSAAMQMLVHVANDSHDCLGACTATSPSHTQ